MSESDLGIKIEIIMWLGDNEWLNTNPPEHDFAMIYFYNFFSKKFEGLNQPNLERILRELSDVGLIELELYWNNRVHIIRGLTPKGINFYNRFKQK